MPGILTVDTGGTTPLALQVLSAVGGLLAAAAAIFVALRTSQAEHRQWLRERRLDAYSAFIDVATQGREAIYSMLRDYQLRGGQLKAIEQRAGQTNEELRRAVGQIGLLGPQEVREAAGVVRFSFAWEGRWAIELLAEYGVDEDHAQVGDIEVDPSRLGLTKERAGSTAST